MPSNLSPRLLTVLVVDDDADDRNMIRDAVRECQANSQLQFVGDGEEAIDYLLHRGKFSAPEKHPRPDLILMDLNMPRMDGRQTIREIKADAKLCAIPIVALTTSKEERDIKETYDLGASSYIAKPVSFEALVQIMRDLDHYWFSVVRLPQVRG